MMYLHDNKGFLYRRAPVGGGKNDEWIAWMPGDIGNPGDRNRAISTRGLGKYLKLSPSNYTVMVCPSDQTDFRKSSYRYSYVINWMFAMDELHPPPASTWGMPPIFYGKITQIKQSSDKILMYEEDERTLDDGNGSIWQPPGDWQYVNLLAIHHDRTAKRDPNEKAALLAGPSYFIPQKDKRGNVLFCDSHVDYVTRQFAHSKSHCAGKTSDLPVRLYGPDTVQ